MNARKRTALAVLVGVLLGFFAGVAAINLTGSSPRRVVAAVAPQDAGAAAATARSTLSAMYGVKQAQVHRAAVSIPPLVSFIQVLDIRMKGCPCPAVFQLQRALKAARVRPARAKSTGVYGRGTAHEVFLFQKRVHLRPSGVYGVATHFKLSKFYDAKARGRLIQVAKDRSVAIKTNHVTHAINVSIHNSPRMGYSQGPSRAFLPSLPAVPLGADCSSWATWVYKVSGLPDPSGFAYRIIGYTGTLAQHGIRIAANAKLQIGDLVFYGGGWPYGHVAVIKDAFLRTVASHGGPGIWVGPFNYRPVSAIRRYF